jgi:hypothetical protein
MVGFVENRPESINGHQGIRGKGGRGSGNSLHSMDLTLIETQAKTPEDFGRIGYRITSRGSTRGGLKKGRV